MTKFVPGGPPRFRHQKRGLRKLIECRGTAALLYEPGLGKTCIALDYCSLLALKAKRGEARVLVIAPLAAIDTWVIQAGTWVSPGVDVWAEALGGSIKQKSEALAARGRKPFATVTGGARQVMARTALHTQRSLAWYGRRDGVDLPDRERFLGPEAVGQSRPRLIIEAVNTDVLSSRHRVGSRTMADIVLEGVKRYAPDLVIIDESHKIKGAGSNVSRLAARIGAVVPRRIILTGTVMPHGPLDVYGQWRFLDPAAFTVKRRDGSRKPMSYGEFQSTYAITGGYLGREVVSYRNLDHMQEIMAERSSVARKAEALDLPATTDVIVPVNLSAGETRAYADMKRDLAVNLGGGHLASSQSRLVMMLRLRQITAGHLPDDAGTVVRVGDSKARTIASIVNDTLAGEKRIVVFAVFRQEIADIVEAVSQKGTVVEKIDGTVPSEKRIAIRRRFGSDDPARIVLVAQIKTLSLAVNELVTASHAVFASLPQQRDDLIQARDRLNRIGQTRPVTFWYALAPKSVDEVMFRSHSARTNLERDMLRHIMGEEGSSGDGDESSADDGRGGGGGS